MTPMINDSDRVFADDTNVTMCEFAVLNTLKFADENSTDISIKMLKLKSIIH